MERFFRYIGYLFEAIIMMLLFIIVLPVRLIDSLVFRTSAR